MLLGLQILFANRRGDISGLIPTLITSTRMVPTSRTPIKKKAQAVDEVDSISAPVIRKSFPESWIFDSINGYNDSNFFSDCFLLANGFCCFVDVSLIFLI